MKNCIAMCALLVVFAFHADAGAQNSKRKTEQSANAAQTQRSPGGDVGSGTGDIGKGAGKGTGEAAKGAGKSAADLATLHPINAAGAAAKGAGKAGKDAGVGAAKGTGKIAKGTGRGIKKIF